MRARSLDRRITFQTFTTVQDAAGEPIKTWTDLITVSASKLDVTGRERFTARQELAEETTVFRIRYRTDINATHRIVYDSKTYDIEGLAELGRREGLDITATAILP